MEFCKREVLLNKCFNDANEFRGRYRMLMGGAGSGKSCNVAMDYLLKLCDEKNAGAGLLVVRKTEQSNLDSTFAEIISAGMRIFGKKWRKYLKVTKSPMKIVCLSTGNEIVFRGMKDDSQKEKLKSINTKNGKICWVWCEEATELRKDDLEIIDDRLRGKLNSELYYQITMSFNPVSATHWIKKRFFDENEHVDNKQVYIHKSTYKDNAFIDGQFEKRMNERKLRDPEGYNVYALGEWGEGSKGRILANYQVKSNSLNERDYEQVAMGMDFGYNHPTVVLLLGIRENSVHVIKELVCHEMDGEEIACEMKKHFTNQAILWCDSAEPDRIKRLKKHGWNARAVKKNAGSVNAQIDWLKWHELIINPNCVKTIEEISSWCWAKDYSRGEWLDVPQIGDDDAMAALRYGIESWRRGKSLDFS